MVLLYLIFCYIWLELYRSQDHCRRFIPSNHRIHPPKLWNSICLKALTAVLEKACSPSTSFLVTVVSTWNEMVYACISKRGPSCKCVDPMSIMESYQKHTTEKNGEGRGREGEREGGRRRRRRRESKREGGRKRRMREARVLVLTSNVWEFLTACKNSTFPVQDVKTNQLSNIAFFQRLIIHL